MATVPAQSTSISATEIDGATLERLHAILAQNDATQLVSETGEAVTVPPALLTVLRTLLGSLEQGHLVQLHDMPDAISVADAAEYLNIFPASVLDLVQKGTIRGIDEGTVRLGDVVKYRQERSARSKAALEEIVRISEEIGLYDVPLSSEDIVALRHRDEPQGNAE